MTDEEIRVRLYAAGERFSLEKAEDFLNYDKKESACADRLLAAHLEITKPLREAADEMERALEKTVSAGNAYDMQCAIMDGQTALARYRAVKGEG